METNGVTTTATQQFLDQNQYTRHGILRYEEIFGRTYVSVGGETTTAQFCSRLDLRPGMKVLDIGCGTGGSAFYMARTYGVEVYGIDLSTNMLDIAREYRETMEPDVKHRVQFHIEDATTLQLPKNFFDVIYSRDAIMHIEDKLSLYKKLLASLKPDGKLMNSEYCHGVNAHSQEYREYIKERDYRILTVKQYGEMLRAAGFRNIVAEDQTDMMVDIMKMELDKFSKIETKFVAKFSQQDYDWITKGWKVKVGRCTRGEQAWGLFTAVK